MSLSPLERGRRALWRWNEGEYWFLRRSHKSMPLTLYCGLPGSGKTLFGVRDAVRLLRQGENVYSNIYIKDRLTGATAGRCMTWLDMLEIAVEALEAGESAYFFWDELHLHCDSREWSLTPKFLLNLFAERRHYRIGLLATTQHAAQVEKRLRTLVDLVVQVRPTGLRRLVRAVVSREFPLFWAEALDGALIDAQESGRLRESDEVVVSRGFFWAPWYAFGSYSTHEVVGGEDLAAYKDAELRDRIAELSARAMAVMTPPEIESYSERHEFSERFAELGPSSESWSTSIEPMPRLGE